MPRAIPANPDLFIIGAMKAATTTLAHMLDAHPLIAVARPKEPQFFSRDERFARGRQWYAECFKHATAGQVKCDGSTCYSRSAIYPRAAERISHSSPDARLVYVLRHPVERAYSHYVHIMQHRFNTGQSLIPLAEFLTSDLECVSASRYATELNHLFQWFRNDQVLCLRFDDVCNDPASAASRIATFAGVSGFDNWPQPQQLNRKASKIQRKTVLGYYDRFAQGTLGQTLKFLFPAAWREVLRTASIEILTRSGLGQRKRDEFLRSFSPLSQEVRAWLHEQLDNETALLENVVGWDVSDWLATGAASGGRTSGDVEEAIR